MGPSGKNFISSSGNRHHLIFLNRTQTLNKLTKTPKKDKARSLQPAMAEVHNTSMALGPPGRGGPTAPGRRRNPKFFFQEEAAASAHVLRPIVYYIICIMLFFSLYLFCAHLTLLIYPFLSSTPFVTFCKMFLESSYDSVKRASYIKL